MLLPHCARPGIIGVFLLAVAAPSAAQATSSADPGFMQQGSFTTFSFEVAGGDIWIRAIRGAGGSIPESASNRIRLVRLSRSAPSSRGAPQPFPR
jgi:hypothetical protein